MVLHSSCEEHEKCECDVLKCPPENVHVVINRIPLQRCCCALRNTETVEGGRRRGASQGPFRESGWGMDGYDLRGTDPVREHGRSGQGAAPEGPGYRDEKPQRGPSRLCSEARCARSPHFPIARYLAVVVNSVIHLSFFVVCQCCVFKVSLRRSHGSPFFAFVLAAPGQGMCSAIGFPGLTALAANSAHEDVCAVCNEEGDLLCCDFCPATHHLTCLDPPMLALPSVSEEVYSARTYMVAPTLCALPARMLVLVSLEDILLCGPKSGDRQRSGRSVDACG